MVNSKNIVAYLGSVGKSPFYLCHSICTAEPIPVRLKKVSLHFWDYISSLRLAKRRFKSKKENPQKLTQVSSRSHPRHLVGKRTAQKDTIIDITSDSQVNSNFPYRWSPASLTFNNYFYLFLYLYIM